MSPLERKHSRSDDVGMPPHGLPTGECACGARWLDTAGGREAHVIVFGHLPEVPTKATRPNSQETQ